MTRWSHHETQGKKGTDNECHVACSLGSALAKWRVRPHDDKTIRSPRVLLLVGPVAHRRRATRVGVRVPADGLHVGDIGLRTIFPVPRYMNLPIYDYRFSVAELVVINTCFLGAYERGSGNSANDWGIYMVGSETIT